MGVVYSAHDDVMGRDVAIKVMMTDLEGEPDIRARFMREAQVSARLAHRNIVTVFDIGEDNGRLFIVMELLRGQTLAECLKQNTLSLEEKVDLTLQVCEGLAVANAAGVCHRDVKPGNLFLQNDGGVKILDFGIARLASSSMTASGFIVGTPDYMSPEQARGGSVDERSDIFSVGAVLYFMLTGRRPFVAPDLPAVLHKVVSEEPPPIDPAEAPPAVARIVLKALTKDPNLRFQKFPELSLELARWRRRYEGETRTLAGETAGAMESLAALADEERQAAEALGVPFESDLHGWLSGIAAGYPEIEAKGADALRSGSWHRSAVADVARRISAVKSAWEPRIATLGAAGADLTNARHRLEDGDARGALTRLENVLHLVPAAAVQSLVERARNAVAERQSREDRLRSLLGDAATASADGRFDAALALAREALQVQPENLEARQVLSRAEQNLATAETDKARRCERYLDRARRALQLEQLEEAERQLALANQTGAAHPDLATLSASLAEARTARDNADAAIQEIAGELARARTEFQEGGRPAAIGRLEALASRYPASAAAQAELARLRTEDQRLAAAERRLADAERLLAEAAEALSKRDNTGAARLAEEALALVPSHELALRTSAVAHAYIREDAERAAREERARRFVETAQTLLARGRFDRAIKEARRAAELDPLGTAGPAVIAEAFRRQAEAAAAETKAKEAARRAADVRDLLQTAAEALRLKDFVRARKLAERAVALQPDSGESKELIAKTAAAAALAAAALEDETVDLHKGAVDPDATAVLSPVTEGRIWRWSLALRLWLRQVWVSRTVNIVRAEVPSSRDPHNKEP
jgi:tetratricopeptide (TPR) repeat protein